MMDYLAHCEESIRKIRMGLSFVVNLQQLQFLFLSRFDVISTLLEYRRTTKWNLFVKFNRILTWYKVSCIENTKTPVWWSLHSEPQLITIPRTRSSLSCLWSNGQERVEPRSTGRTWRSCWVAEELPATVRTRRRPKSRLWPKSVHKQNENHTERNK